MTQRLVITNDGEQTVVADARPIVYETGTWWAYDSDAGIPLTLTLVEVTRVLGRSWTATPNGGGQGWIITTAEEARLIEASAANVATQKPERLVPNDGELVETENGLEWRPRR